MKQEKKNIIPPPISDDDELVAQVYSTTHYEKFKLIEQNREVDHVKALKISFQKRDVPNAIIVNESFEIIEGQNRFFARKELGLPILYYIIEGLDIYDVAALNSFSKNWQGKDFINMYASLGKESYKIANDFHNNFPDLPLHLCIQILADSTSVGHGSVGSDKDRKNRKFDEVRTGDFKVSDLDHAYFVARCIMKYKAFSRPGLQIYKQTAFVSAMIQLLRQDNFDNDEMVRKAALFPTMFYRCLKAKEYIKMLEDLWNYKRSKNKKTFKF